MPPIAALRARARCLFLAALFVGAAPIAIAQTPTTLSFAQSVCTQSVLGSVTLSGPAPAAGQVVQLSSNMPAVISVAPTVTVPAGATSAPITLRCAPGNQSVAVSLSASANNVSQTAIMNVPSASLEAVALKTEQIPPLPPTSFTGTVTLAGSAPVGGVIVTLSNSDPTLLTSPPSVTVPAGARSASFNVTVRSPVSQRTPFSITATGLGVTRIGTGTLMPAEPLTLAFPDRQREQRGLDGGSSTQLNIAGSSPPIGARLTLNAAAGAAGLTLTVSSSNPGWATVPATVTVRPGDTSVDFTVQTSPTTQSASTVITATGATVSKTATLATGGTKLVGLTGKVTQVIGGQTAAFTVFASSRPGPEGLLIRLSSSNPSAMTVPASVTIPANTSTADVTVTTASVTARTTVTLTASAGGFTQTEPLLLVPEGLTQFDVSPTSVTGGSSVSGLLTAFSGHDGFNVTITSDQPSVVGVPTTVSVPANQATQGFSITTSPVSVPTTVRLSARLTAGSRINRLGVLSPDAPHPALTASLTVNPPTLRSLSLSSQAVLGSSPFTGTLTLSGPAPEGLAATVVSGDELVMVESPVRFTAGATTATFSARTLPGRPGLPGQPSQPVRVSITARIGNAGTASTATINVLR